MVFVQKMNLRTMVSISTTCVQNSRSKNYFLGQTIEGIYIQQKVIHRERQKSVAFSRKKNFIKNWIVKFAK